MAECDKFVSDDINQLMATKEHGDYFKNIPQKIYADLDELASGGRTTPESKFTLQAV